MADTVEHTVWMPYRANANGPTVQLPLMLRYAPSLPQKPTEGVGVLFTGFMKYASPFRRNDQKLTPSLRWLKNQKSPYYGSAGRSAKPKHILLRPVRAIVEARGWGKYSQSILVVKPTKHEPWMWQPLILVDPFVPTFVRILVSCFIRHAQLIA